MALLEQYGYTNTEACFPAVGMEIRRAGLGDSRDVFMWRNDLCTREMSRNQAELSWKEHEAWYRKAVDDADRKFLIGEMNGEKVGMVRFDRLGTGAWEISVNLNPEMRGKRLSVELLDLALRCVKGKRIVGEVKDCNIASQRMVTAYGFKLTGKIGEYLQYEIAA